MAILDGGALSGGSSLNCLYHFIPEILEDVNYTFTMGFSSRYYIIYKYHGNSHSERKILFLTFMYIIYPFDDVSYPEKVI